jgi:autotransporter-associated beta strand protein/predicted outer membrane repeat protein
MRSLAGRYDTKRLSRQAPPRRHLLRRRLQFEPLEDRRLLSRILWVDLDAHGAGDGSNWQNAYPRLQDALLVAANGDEIRVAQGVYTPTAVADYRAATFRLVSGVAVKGGYAGWGATDPDARDVQAFPTILSGDLRGDDGPNFANNGENSYHVVTASGVNATALLDGLTITAGNANGGSFGGAATAGGGIYNDAGSPTIVHCTLRGNCSSWEGGAMFNWHNARPTLTQCTIIGNQSNAGGGMFNRDGSGPTLANCLVADNAVPAYGGGGIEQLGSSVTLAGCSFYGNSCMYAGSAIYSVDWQSTVTATNCVFWGNPTTSQPGGSQISSQATVTYSCVQDTDPDDTVVQPGVGNIDDDPRFVEPLGADNLIGTGDENVRLRPGSPCIDTGSNAAVPAGLTADLDGQPRIVGGRVDMGACEGPHQALLLSTRSVTIDEGGTVTLTVALAMDPLGPVNVTVARGSGDTDIGVAEGGLLMFDASNYATPQTVTLAAGPDLDWLNGTALIEFSAPGLTSAGASVTERDTDAPPVMYVDQSATGAGTGENWANACTDLQQAIGFAAVQPQVHEIRVAQGTYRPAGAGDSRAATFTLVNNVAMYGGFPQHGGTWEQRDPAAHPTILSGDLNANDMPVAKAQDLAAAPGRGDNCYHVVTAAACDATTVLDGFTITGGNANGEYPDTNGGGINGGELTLRNSTIVENFASSSGGGMSTQATVINSAIIRNAAGSSSGGGSASILADTTISDNWAGHSGGGMSMYTGTLTRCTISGNIAESGAGISIDSGAPTFTQCVFSGNTAANQGGAIYGWEMEVSNFDQCDFIANSAQSGGAVSQGDCDTIFTACRFLGNAAGSGGAIDNFGYNLPVFVNCAFSGNSAAGDGGAVLNREGSVPVLTNCTISANTAGQYGGGVASAENYSSQMPYNIRAANCIFWGNRDRSGTGESAQVFQDAGASAVNYSCMQGWTGALGGTGNTGGDPQFVDANGSDNVTGTKDDNLRLRSGSPCIDAADNAALPTTVIVDLANHPRFVDDPNTPDTGSGTPPLVDMGAYEVQQSAGPSVLYVDGRAAGSGNGTSWANAFTALQDALTLARTDANIQEIRVAGGVYRPDQGAGQTPGDRLETFKLLSGVAIRGGYAGFGQPAPDARDVQLYKTVLSGDLAGNDIDVDLPPQWQGIDDLIRRGTRGDNSYTVVTGSGVDHTAVLEGVTISGGHSDAPSPDCYTPPGEVSWVAGGGMYNDSGSPTLIDVVFHLNSVCSSYRLYPGGTGGGGVFNLNSSPIFVDCRFDQNIAFGADASIAGGGMYNRDSHPTLTSCVFSGNIATGYDADYYGGAISNVDSSPTLSNCLVVNNHSEGGSVWNWGESSPTLTNCTLIGPCGIFNEGEHSSPTLTNCILWGIPRDGYPPIPQIYGGTPAVSLSCVQDWQGGVGNIAADPRFVDPGHWDNNGTPEDYDDIFIAGNYHLQPGSPCVNAGDTSAVPPSVTTDLDGNPRIFGGRVDMGAYELQEAGLANVIYVDARATGVHSGGSWVNAFTTLQDALTLARTDSHFREIRVAAGTYRPAGQGGSREATFQLVVGASVRGGYAGLGAADPDARDTSLYPTILTGDLNGDDGPSFANNEENSYHVVVGSGCDATAVLEGFTITAGNANGPDEDGEWVSVQCGGGMYNCAGSPTVIDCTFLKNQDEYRGSGVYNHQGSNTTLTNCVFRDNLPGGMLSSGSSPTLSGCVFTGSETAMSASGPGNATLTQCQFIANRSQYDYGAGMRVSGSSPVLTDCLFEDNWSDQGGAALYLGEQGNAVVTDCVFRNNSAHWSGGAVYSLLSNPVFTDCTFSGNAAHDGGAIAVVTWVWYDGAESNPALANCVFVGNTAADRGGAISLQTWRQNHLSLTNCTFAGNVAASGSGLSCDSFMHGSPSDVDVANCIFSDGGNEIVNSDQSRLSVTCSDVRGGLGGTGNINADPRFVRNPGDGGDGWGVGNNDDFGDLRLRCDSPCINAGSNAAIPPGVTTDRDGNARIVGATVDMGAYEFVVRATWQGPGDGNWEDAGSWQGAGASGPDCNTDAVLDAPHTVQINSPQQANSLVVSNGAALSIITGAGLAVAGNTVVDADGMLEIAPGASLSTGGTLTLNGGSLLLPNNPAYGTASEGETGGAGSVEAATFDLKAGTVAVGLSGSGALIKSTAGTVVLNGVNTFTGGTTVSGGVLVVGGADALPAGGSLTIGGGGTVASAGGLSAVAGPSAASPPVAENARLPCCGAHPSAVTKVIPATAIAPLLAGPTLMSVTDLLMGTAETRPQPASSAPVTPSLGNNAVANDAVLQSVGREAPWDDFAWLRGLCQRSASRRTGKVVAVDEQVLDRILTMT